MATKQKKKRNGGEKKNLMLDTVIELSIANHDNVKKDVHNRYFCATGDDLSGQQGKCSPTFTATTKVHLTGHHKSPLISGFTNSFTNSA